MANAARKIFAGVYFAQKRGINGSVTTHYGAVNVRAVDDKAARKVLEREYKDEFPTHEGWDVNFSVKEVPTDWIDTAYAELHADIISAHSSASFPDREA